VQALIASPYFAYRRETGDAPEGLSTLAPNELAARLSFGLWGRAPNAAPLDQAGNGDGDSHARTNMPVLVAGHAGEYKTGRVIAAKGQPTGALHASSGQKLGLPAASYGNPAGNAIAGF
jgi:hypothetical protein